jgi:hypothetical protein
MRDWPVTITFAVMIAAILAPPVRAQHKPFTQDQIQGMVRAGLADESGAKLIEQRGIDFAPTDDFLASLKTAGANEAFLGALRGAKHPEEVTQPLTKGQVMDLVKFGMDSAELVGKIKDVGIDFEPTQDYLGALRKAGAQEVVIQALLEKPKPLTREQVGKLVAGGVPSERAAALVKQRGIDFEADEQYLGTLRMAGANDTLLASLRSASTVAAAALEQSKLEEVRSASAQLYSFRMMEETTLLEKAVAGDQRAGTLADELKENEQRFERWQRLEWTPDLGSQKGDKIVMPMDDGRAYFCCFPPGSNRLYPVEAPPRIRWNILMEKTRWEIGDMGKAIEFLHPGTSDNDMMTIYQDVWEEARDYYCKHGPGAKFTDLNGQEQVCSQPQITSSQ